MSNLPQLLNHHSWVVIPVAIVVIIVIVLNDREREESTPEYRTMEETKELVELERNKE